MFEIRFDADFFDPPKWKLSGQHEMKSFPECRAGCLAAEFMAVRCGQIGDLKFAFGFGEAFCEQRDLIAAFEFQTSDFAYEIPWAGPCLKNQTAIPFSESPLAGDQGEWFFAGIEDCGMNCPGYETLYCALEVLQIGLD